jgi:hypothetical protein
MDDIPYISQRGRRPAYLTNSHESSLLNEVVMELMNRETTMARKINILLSESKDQRVKRTLWHLFQGRIPQNPVFECPYCEIDVFRNSFVQHIRTNRHTFHEMKFHAGT